MQGAETFRLRSGDYLRGRFPPINFSGSHWATDEIFTFKGGAFLRGLLLW
jgi:hypothetical protein